MPQRWLVPERIEVPSEIKALVGGHPMVSEILVRRGFSDVQTVRGFLDPDSYQPASALELPGMTAAVDRIRTAVIRGEKVCVWGDFDVDGQTATTLLFSLLRHLGADVFFHIPIRETESHGMKLEYLKEEIQQGAKCILTCDTGIDAVEAVNYANELGVDVVITDHHECPVELPPATAIVNPHLLEAGHPLETLPGVGVAYKFAEALLADIGKPEEAETFLDLVALGIVADVAVLVNDTRYLLQKGLEVLRRTKRLGLQALMTLANIRPETVTATDIGFAIAPRMNALGRLADANSIVELLTTEDLSRARILASGLESLNTKRKKITDDILKAAIAQIEHDPSLLDYAALVLSNPAWPPGVIGIVANRLADIYSRPVVALATPEGELARGSARSVPGCHITEAISTQSHLLEGSGGHEQAAGLSLSPENIPAFRRGLSRAVLSQMGGKAVEPPLVIDGFVSLDTLSLDFIDDLNRLAPFGPGNPPIHLGIKNVHIRRHRTIGRNKNHLRIDIADQHDRELQILWWQWDGASLPEGLFDLAFTAEATLYRGERSMQLTWLAYRISEPEVFIPETALTQLEIVDYRCRGHLKNVLKEVSAMPNAVIWREGPAARTIPGQDRLSLHPAENLVIWTPPASRDILERITAHVSPKRIYIIGDASQCLEKPTVFLRYLTGLVKFASKDGLPISLAKFSAATGHETLTVRKGISWLAAHGDITPHFTEAGSVSIEIGGQNDVDKAAYILEELKTLLAETAAFRRHFTHIDTDAILKMLH